MVGFFIYNKVDFSVVEIFWIGLLGLLGLLLVYCWFIVGLLLVYCGNFSIYNKSWFFCCGNFFGFGLVYC